MLEQIWLQVATQPIVGSDPIVNLIIAISILLGTVSTIVSAIFARVAQNAKGKAKETAQQVVAVADYAVEASKQVVNNEQKIKGVANVIYALSPEQARQLLAKANITIEDLTEDAKRTTAELNKLGEYIPVNVDINANHKNIPDQLPEVAKHKTSNTTT